ncbi:hypothetical protein [Aeromonas jandaei]|uniref:hypothetical protein n=1 Tax=Aeromonas jandaei TaxID=650 RepID=UPI003BA1DE55
MSLRILLSLLVLVGSGCATMQERGEFGCSQQPQYGAPFGSANDGWYRCVEKKFACTPANIRRDRAMEARRDAQERANHRGDDW